MIGQALVAAVRTVEVRPPHSMHAYFLLPGDPKVPIIYDVDRMRDGKSFTTRRVTARQHGHPIFSMLVSFHRDEQGLDHQAKMPDVPPPEDLAERSRYAREIAADHAGCGAALLRARAADRIAARSNSTAISARNIPTDTSMSGSAPPAKLPDDPAIHQCVLAYASDMSCSTPRWRRTAARCSKRNSWRRASITRCGCIGRSAPTNGCSTRRIRPNLHGSRGFARGLIFTRDGTLVASVAQEGLVRVRRRKNLIAQMK